jgi:hypothetical protein
MGESCPPSIEWLISRLLRRKNPHAEDNIAITSHAVNGASLLKRGLALSFLPAGCRGLGCPQFYDRHLSTVARAR